MLFGFWVPETERDLPAIDLGVRRGLLQVGGGQVRLQSLNKEPMVFLHSDRVCILHSAARRAGFFWPIFENTDMLQFGTPRGIWAFGLASYLYPCTYLYVYAHAYAYAYTCPDP